MRQDGSASTAFLTRFHGLILFFTVALAQPLTALASGTGDTPEPDPCQGRLQTNGLSPTTSAGDPNAIAGFWASLAKVVEPRFVAIDDYLDPKVRALRSLPFKGLPNYQGPKANLPLDEQSLETWRRAARLMDMPGPQTTSFLMQVDAVSRSAVGGHVELTDLALTPELEDEFDRAWHYMPAVLGRLPSGQPVMVYLLENVHMTRSMSLEVAPGAQAAQLIERAITQSYLPRGLAFYGVQRVSSRLYGLILEMPPAGNPFQFGGHEFFGPQAFLDIIEIMQTMRRFRWDIRGVDLRPYITSDARALAVPTFLGHIPGLSRSPFLSIRDELDQFAAMGLRISDEEITRVERVLRSRGLAQAIFPFLEELVARGATGDLSEALADLDRPQLIRFADERRAHFLRMQLAALARGRSPEPSVSAERTFAAATAIRTALGAPDSEVYGPETATFRYGQWVGISPLKIGDSVVIGYTAVRQNARSAPSHLRVGDTLMGQVVGIAYDANQNLRITLRIEWRNGNEVTEDLDLSADEWSLLGTYTFRRNDFQNPQEFADVVLGPLMEQARKAAESRQTAVMIEELALSPEETAAIIASAQEHTRLRGLSPSVRGGLNSHVDGDNRSSLPSHPKAFEAARSLSQNLSEEDRAYLTPLGTRLLIVKDSELQIYQMGGSTEHPLTVHLGEKDRIVHIGNRLAFTIDTEEIVSVVDLRTGHIIGRERTSGLVQVFTSQDERTIALAQLAFTTFHRVDVSNGQRRLTGFNDRTDLEIRLFQSSMQLSTEAGQILRDPYNSHAVPTPDSRFAVYAFYDYSGGNARIGVVNLLDATAYPTVDTGLEDVSEIHVAPDGNHVVVQSAEGQVRVFRFNPGAAPLPPQER